MSCSIIGITNSVSSENKKATEKFVREAVHTSIGDRAKATDNPLSLLSSIIGDANPTLEGKKVHLLDLARIGKEQFKLKYRLGKSSKIIETTLGAESPFKSDFPGLRIDSNSLETFYSDYKYSHNSDDFEDLALDITNNPEKILETAETLIAADEYHNDPSYNKVLMHQLGLIQDSLVGMTPHINVHINNKGSANYGKVVVNTGDMFITKGIGGSKSLLEIYVHELYHTVTHFALSSKSTDIHKIKARIAEVRRNFVNLTSEKNLITMSGNKLTFEQAASLLDHLSDPNVGLHEFVALSMTNKAVMGQLSSLNMMHTAKKEHRKMFQRLVELVVSLFHNIAKRVTGEPDNNDLARMAFLVSRLHSAHKKPLQAKKTYAIRNLISIFGHVTKIFTDYLDRAIKNNNSNVSRNAIKKGESNLKYYSRLASRSFYDDEARDILGSTVGLLSQRKSMFSFLSPEATIRTMLRDATQSDLTQDKAERLGLTSGNIDQQREFLAVQTSIAVMSYFNSTLIIDQEEMLTGMVLDTDLSSIYDTHDMDRLLSSDSEINKTIKDKEHQLKAYVDNDVLNFYRYQTSLLAEYMVNGTDNIALLLNSENIAKMLNTGRDIELPNKKVVDLIDEMATLKALKLRSNDEKIQFKDLIKNEPEGVKSIVAFQQGQKLKAIKDVFPTASDKLKIIKGYSTQITNPDISIVSAPLSKKTELESQGYTLKSTLDKHELDTNATPMALYINHRFMDATFHRVGMRLTDKPRRGVTVTESFFKGDESHKTLKSALAVKELQNRRNTVINKMFDGSYDVELEPDDSLLTPLLDNIGQVKDFRYNMDKDNKIELLDMERKISVIMGRTSASTYDKKESDSFNYQMMELIKEDARKNKNGLKSNIGRNNKEYIKIEKESNNAEIKALWKVLPNNIKVAHPTGFFVRRDLMYTYLGYREMGIEDVLAFGLKGKELTTAVKHIIKFAEKLWQEIVKISKIDIILRTPGVFIGNIISNFMLMYYSGYTFKEILALKYQGVKELNLYTKGLKESIILNAKKEAGIIKPSETRRLNVIENDLNGSPVKDLVDEGFYTTIIEEIEHGQETGSYFNRLAKKKLKNMPKIVKYGLDVLYITENTQLLKLIEKGTQASDFAARYAQYHLMIESGTDKTEAIKTVRDNFIDYNKPESRFINWLSKNGFIMFTRYFTRIQRVIRNYGFKHPDRILLALLAQDYALGDVDDITDQSIVTKNLDNLFYNPWDHIKRVLTPSALEAVEAGIGKYNSITN